MTLSVGTGWREPLHPFPSFSMDPFRDNVLGSFKWFCWQSKHFHLRVSWIVVSVLLVLDLRWHVKKMCFLWRPVTEHDQTVLRPTEQESDILEVLPGKQTFKLACAQHAFTRCAFFILHIRNAFAIASTPRTARREFGWGNSQIWLFCAFALAGTRSADHHFREHGRGLSLLWNGTSVALTQKILEHCTYWQFSGYCPLKFNCAMSMCSESSKICTESTRSHQAWMWMERWQDRTHNHFPVDLYHCWTEAFRHLRPQKQQRSR